MRKKNFIKFLLIIISIFMVTTSAFSKTKKIYIKAFQTGKDFTDNGLKDEIKDYMSEILVLDESISLMSDDEVKQYVRGIALSQSTGDDKNDAVKLLKSIESDLIIYGKVYKLDGEYIIESSILEITDDELVKIKNSGEIKFRRRTYVDRASRALAEYLLIDKAENESRFLNIGKKEPIKDFYDEVDDLEIEMKRLEAKFVKGQEYIDFADQWRTDCLENSPFIRVSYGGFGLVQFASSDLKNSYGNNGQKISVDLFFYKYKDPVGDGVDLFAKGTYRLFENGPATMKHYGIDLGVRFVGTAYFFREAWSLYISGAYRYLNVREEGGILSQENNSGEINTWGIIGGAGLEVSLHYKFGIFAEYNYGYVPIGGSKMNLEGHQVTFGVTYRSEHWF